MAVRFDFHTDPPIEGLTFACSRAEADLSDLSDLFRVFEDLFKGGMKEQFGSEGGWGAGGWASLSDQYAKWKAEHYPGPIGYLHGALRAAMTGGEGYDSKIGPKSAEFGLGGGPAAKYGRYFAGGTEKMPARPIIAFPASYAKAHQKAAHRHVMGVMQQALAGF